MLKRRKRREISLLVFLLFFFLGPLPAGATLVISPALVKLELSQQRSSGSFIIKNTGDVEERYRAKSVFFTVTSRGGLKEIPPDEYSLAGWIKFNPKEFVLPPKSSRLVRFSVIPEGKLKPREYWGAIEFMPLDSAKFESKTTDGRSLKLNVSTVILVPVYGFVSGTQYSGKFKQLTAQKAKDSLEVSSTITNTGEGVLRLSGRCEIVDLTDKLVEDTSVKTLVIFPKTERIFKVILKKAFNPGKYRVRINLKSVDSHSKLVLSNESEFTL